MTETHETNGQVREYGPLERLAQAERRLIEQLHQQAEALDRVAANEELTLAQKRLADSCARLKGRLGRAQGYARMNIDLCSAAVVTLADWCSDDRTRFDELSPAATSASVDAYEAAIDADNYPGYVESYVRAAEEAAALDAVDAAERTVIDTPPDDDDRETIAPGDERYYRPAEFRDDHLSNESRNIAASMSGRGEVIDPGEQRREAEARDTSREPQPPPPPTVRPGTITRRRKKGGKR